jgi:hypothetical protein
VPIEREVRLIEGDQRFALRIHPSPIHGDVAGVVIIFANADDARAG